MTDPGTPLLFPLMFDEGIAMGAPLTFDLTQPERLSGDALSRRVRLEARKGLRTKKRKPRGFYSIDRS